MILIGTAVLLTLGMGMRQSFGLFLAPVTHDLAVTAADFTLALAVQNIVWGLSQALVGAIADRFGLRITMMAGAALYVVGLGIMASAQGALALIISGGLIGVALSCTATSLAMAACVRAVSEERRSMMLGLVSAAGSLGTMVVPLATQALLAREPWQIAALFFVLMAVAMLPAAFWAGGADRIPGPSTATNSMREVLGQAMRNRPFLVMSGAYFVCGLNLVFLSTHLPAYLAICGQDPMLGAEALAVIGGASAIGSLLTGWLGGRYPKHYRTGGGNPTGKQKAALAYAECITWDLPSDDALWERLHKHFSEPELVEIGYFVAITMGQQRWLRTLNIEHHQILAGTDASMAPGFETMEGLLQSKSNPSYWANKKAPPKNSAA